MKILYTIFYSFFILLLLGVAGLFLTPLLPIENNIQIKIVESGSMEPAIHTGAIVVVRPASAYKVGDVITFKSASAEIPTTHRVVNIHEENGTTFFTTKGDANEEADTNEVAQGAVLGKVLVSAPYAGFILDFARQPVGFSLLIGLPALMIVLGEIEKIWVEVRKRRDERRIEKLRERVVPEEPKNDVPVRMMDIGRPAFPQKIAAVVPMIAVQKRKGLQLTEVLVCAVVTILCIVFTSMSFIGGTVSYFNDVETSLANTFTAAGLDFNVLAEPEEISFFKMASADTNSVDGSWVYVVSPEKGSGDLEYNVRVEKVEGSDIFCSAILASSFLPIEYEGPLLGLTAEGVAFLDPWAFTTSLSDTVTGYVEGDVCFVDVVYTASDSESEGGYSDEERVRLEFFAPVAEVGESEEKPSALPEETPVGDEGEGNTPDEETEATDEPIDEGSDIEDTEGDDSEGLQDEPIVEEEGSEGDTEEDDQPTEEPEQSTEESDDSDTEDTDTEALDQEPEPATSEPTE